jgi:uncharacterized protein DUF4920
MTRFLMIGLFFFAAGCVGDTTPTLEPEKEYDSFGEMISPDDAIPAQLVVAEGAALIGQSVKIEGRISQVCQGNGCWLTLQVVDGPVIRINVPTGDDGAFLYAFPKEASGRRAILSGVLESEGAAESEDGGLDQSAYTLTATGALLERVRA